MRPVPGGGPGDRINPRRRALLDLTSYLSAAVGRRVHVDVRAP